MPDACPQCDTDTLIEHEMLFHECDPRLADEIMTRQVVELACPNCGWYQFTKDEVFTPAMPKVVLLDWLS